MIHLLRNDNNRFVIECETTEDSLHSTLNINVYSEMLINLFTKDGHQVEYFIKDIDYLYQLRNRWWWILETQPDKFASMDDFVKDAFEKIADKYSLKYSVD